MPATNIKTMLQNFEHKPFWISCLKQQFNKMITFVAICLNCFSNFIIQFKFTFISFQIDIIFHIQLGKLSKTKNFSYKIASLLKIEFNTTASKYVEICLYTHVRYLDRKKDYYCWVIQLTKCITRKMWSFG